MVRLPRNEKQTHQLNSRPQMWPPNLILAMTLTLNFQGQIWNLLYINQKWSDCHGTKSKHIDLNSRPQNVIMGLNLAMTLIFEFSRSYVILTICWPRLGVRIYQIVTGVTSDVGMPSTHLVVMRQGSLSSMCPCYLIFSAYISCLFSTKPLFNPMMICSQLHIREWMSSRWKYLFSWKCLQYIICHEEPYFY